MKWLTIIIVTITNLMWDTFICTCWLKILISHIILIHFNYIYIENHYALIRRHSGSAPQNWGAAQIDDVDSQSRRNVMMFGGIDEAKGDNLTSTVLSTVHVLVDLLQIQPSAIEHCHRLGTSSNNHSRPILVRFYDMSTKQMIWSNMKKLKSSAAVISKFLTKNRQALIVKARKYFEFRSSWTLNDNVYVKLPTGERKRVPSLDDVAGRCNI